MATYLVLLYINRKNNFCLNCQFGSYQCRKKKFHEYITSVSFNRCWIFLFYLWGLASLCCYVSKNTPLPLKSVCYLREEADNCCLTLKYSNTKWRHVTESTLTELCWRSLFLDLMESSNVKCLPASTQAFVCRVWLRDCIYNCFVYWMWREGEITLLLDHVEDWDAMFVASPRKLISCSSRRAI